MPKGPGSGALIAKIGGLSLSRLSLAYSPCPNDTFIFGAIAAKLVNLKGMDMDIHLHDVEELNRACMDSRYDVSKISIAALPHLEEKYGLLYSGGALGRGCGPLVVSRPGFDLKDLVSARIAVPGIMTTAYVLVCLFAGQPLKVTPMRFDSIMPSVSRGEYDLGVIIHEGRFTYQGYGLCQLLDLGQWWEQQTGLPIPLGGIAIRRGLGQDLARKVDHLISHSLSLAQKNPRLTENYIKRHAQEMEETVIKQHIELYVNEYTNNIGEEGQRAIKTLLTMGADIGLLPHLQANLMAYP